VFDQLSEKFVGTLRKAAWPIEDHNCEYRSAVKELRLGLLEADVNFKVVKNFN